MCFELSTCVQIFKSDTDAASFLPCEKWQTVYVYNHREIELLLQPVWVIFIGLLSFQKPTVPSTQACVPNNDVILVSDHHHFGHFSCTEAKNIITYKRSCPNLL